MRNRRDLLLAGLVILFAVSLPLSIAVAEAALALAVIVWLGLPRERRGVPKTLIAAAAVYAGLTLLSAATSGAATRCLEDCKELLLLSVLLVTPAAARVAGAARLRLAVLAGATAASIWGLVDYLSTPGGLLFRTTGPYGHYMTFAGVLMLTLVALLAEPAAAGWRSLRQAPALARILPLPLLGGALAVSFARNAWIGLAAGLAVLVALTRPKLLLLSPVVIVAALLVAPADIRERALSPRSWQEDQSSTERLQMVEAGLRMIADHPLLGVGPDLVQENYPAYRSPEAPDRKPSHLHNNLVQIAAERGLPALGAWLAFLGLAVWEAWRRRRRPELRASSLGTLAAVAALFAAGLFEYNFGDSEVLMLFLLIVALPCARPHPSLESP